MTAQVEQMHKCPQGTNTCVHRLSRQTTHKSDCSASLLESELEGELVIGRFECCLDKGSVFFCCNMGCFGACCPAALADPPPAESRTRALLTRFASASCWHLATGEATAGAEVLLAAVPLRLDGSVSVAAAASKPSACRGAGSSAPRFLCRAGAAAPVARVHCFFVNVRPLTSDLHSCSTSSPTNCMAIARFLCSLFLLCAKHRYNTAPPTSEHGRQRQQGQLTPIETLHDQLTL